MARGWHQQFKRAPKNERTNREGITFDSKSEMIRYERLRQMILAGEVRNLRRQVVFPLIVNERRIGKYTADFVYDHRAGDSWIEIVEEHKGYFDEFSRFRIALFEALYGIEVLMTGEAKRG